MRELAVCYSCAKDDHDDCLKSRMISNAVWMHPSAPIDISQTCSCFDRDHREAA